MIGLMLILPLGALLLAGTVVTGALVVAMGAVTSMITIATGMFMGSLMICSTAVLAVWMFIMS
jgi:hypothetical protein